jgi:hypothetical protein
MVRFVDQTELDSRAQDHWLYLAVPLPRDSAHVRLCLRPKFARRFAVVGGLAVRHQYGGQPFLHSNSIRLAESATCRRGYRHRLADDRVDDGRHMEPLQMDRDCSGSVSDLGFTCDGPAVFHHLEQLGPLDLCEGPRVDRGGVSPQYRSTKQGRRHIPCAVTFKKQSILEDRRTALGVCLLPVERYCFLTVSRRRTRKRYRGQTHLDARLRLTVNQARTANRYRACFTKDSRGNAVGVVLNASLAQSSGRRNPSRPANPQRSWHVHPAESGNRSDRRSTVPMPAFLDP